MSDKAIGVDLGGTNLRVALVEVDGTEARILDQRRQLLQERSPHAVAQVLVQLCHDLDAAGAAPVGIGAAAMLHGTKGMVANAPNLGWRDVDFGALVAKDLGRPVSLENDLSAITWGEHRFGAARGFDDVICVFVGTGVGGGAVLCGELYRGAGNAALEIGHLKVHPGGRLCGCGQRGCLEAYAGGRALAELAREAPESLWLEIAGGDAEALHGGHLDQAAQRGDARAKEVVGRASIFLGQALASVATLFNPSCLLLGGTVWQGCAFLREEATRTLKELLPLPAAGWMQCVEATLEDDAGVLGAADLALAHRAAARGDHKHRR
ncbi:MAG: ROK family protein [Deltaproteobacteria bacterium]|nr:ROK family protein [Deltaproteobacteria bacterium]